MDVDDSDSEDDDDEEDSDAASDFLERSANGRRFLNKVTGGGGSAWAPGADGHPLVVLTRRCGGRGGHLALRTGLCPPRAPFLHYHWRFSLFFPPHRCTLITGLP